MARQISTIQNQILAQVAADPTLGPLLTSPSKRALYQLFSFVIATAIALLEQIQDLFTSSTEASIAAAAPGTPAWIQSQVFLFQYDPLNVQIIQLINFAPAYPVINAALRIISRCSVTTELNGVVDVKVATGNPPAQLTTDQFNNLNSYLTSIGVAGINFRLINLAADMLYIQASIYYSGQFSQVISANVITAIGNYLAAIPFNGIMKISDLELAIKNVPGVTDIVFNNVSARQATVAFGSGALLISNNLAILREWQTVSGYILPETTTGQTLSTSLTFIAE